MPPLTIRDVPDHVLRALRMRAADHGRSVEAEVRAVLMAAVAAVVAPVEGAVAEEQRTFSADAPSAIGVWGRSGRSEVDQFIAQRTVEAAFESEEITAEEYAHLNERIGAWEVDSEWVDRFLAQRRGEA